MSKERLMKYLVGASLVVACVVRAGAVRSAGAADEWFVLGEKTLKTADPSTEIKAQGNRWQRNVNQVKPFAEEIQGAPPVDVNSSTWSSHDPRLEPREFSFSAAGC